MGVWQGRHMNGSHNRIDTVKVRWSARWQRAADRLARYAWVLLLVSVTVGLISGVVVAAVWQPEIDPAPSSGVVCPDPPCFGGGGLPGLESLPFVVTMLGYLFAIVLGVPSLLAGVWDVLHGRWAVGGRRFLPFLGPVLFFVGTEIIPHLVNPCIWAFLWNGTLLSEFYCAYDAACGTDLADRWHLLQHTLVGALPLATLYWWALRRWHPQVARLRNPPSPAFT